MDLPRHFGIPAGTESAVTSISQWLLDRQLMTDLIE
jgi:hypothetical protein